MLKSNVKYLHINSLVRYDYINELAFFNATQTNIEGYPVNDPENVYISTQPSTRKLIGKGDWIKLWNFFEDEKKPNPLLKKLGEELNMENYIRPVLGYKIDRFNPTTSLWEYIYEKVKI